MMHVIVSDEVKGVYRSEDLAKQLQSLAEEVQAIAAIDPEKDVHLNIEMRTTTSIDMNQSKHKNYVWAIAMGVQIEDGLYENKLQAYFDSKLKGKK